MTYLEFVEDLSELMNLPTDYVLGEIRESKAKISILFPDHEYDYHAELTGLSLIVAQHILIVLEHGTTADILNCYKLLEGFSKEIISYQRRMN